MSIQITSKLSGQPADGDRGAFTFEYTTRAIDSARPGRVVRVRLCGRYRNICADLRRNLRRVYQDLTVYLVEVE